MAGYSIGQLFRLCFIVFGYLAVVLSSVHYIYDVFNAVMCSPPLVSDPQGKEKWFKLLIIYMIIAAVYIASGGVIGVLAGRTISAADSDAHLHVYIWLAGISGIIMAALARITFVSLGLRTLTNTLFLQVICTFAAILLFTPLSGPLQLWGEEILNPLINAIPRFPSDQLLAFAMLLVMVLVITEVGIRHR